MDVSNSLHGHVAELIDVNAPASVIRKHVRAMRQAIHSSKKWFGQASNDMVAILEKPDKHAGAARLYKNHLKNGADMLEGAYALIVANDATGRSARRELRKTLSRVRSANHWGGRRSEKQSSLVDSSSGWGRRRRRKFGKSFKRTVKKAKKAAKKASDAIKAARKWVKDIIMLMFRCIGVGFGFSNLYATGTGGCPEFVPPNCMGIVVTMSFSIGGSTGGLIKLLDGEGFCFHMYVKLAFTVFVGQVFGAPKSSGSPVERKGAAIEASFAINGCAKSLVFVLSASLSGSLAWKPKRKDDCLFGWSVGPFNCVKSVGIGLTIVCCVVDLLTHETDC